MNKERRKLLIKAQEMIDEARSLIEDVKDEEDDAYSNLPENLIYSERGEEMEDNVTALEDVLDELEEVSSALEDIAE